jgi:hypothetical protein
MATAESTQQVATYQLPIHGRAGIVAYTSVLDDEFTRVVLAARRWHLTAWGYAKSDSRQDGVRKTLVLHCFVYQHYHGEIRAGLKVDHIDRNKLNNRPDNLRALTHSQNIANRPRQKNNTSGYVGVYWHRGGRKWGANIMVMRKHIHLGLFSTAEGAAVAVNDAYAKHFPHVPPPNPV